MVYSTGRLYLAGGISFNGGIVDAAKVYSAPVSAGGTVGAWSAGPALPEAVFYHASAAANGFVYVLGGYHYSDAEGMVVSDAVSYAKVESGGLGAWHAAIRLPQPMFFPSVAVWNGRLYVTGGWNGTDLLRAVYSAVVNADGSLGPWIAQKPLPDAVYTHAEVSNGTLYVLGGIVNGGNDIQNSVYFAKIHEDGTLADWATTSPLPRPVANHGAILANGRVFVTGGWVGNGPTDAVNSAAIAADGSLGGWTLEAPLPTVLYLHGSATDGSYMYVSGGNDAENMRADVYSMPLPAAAAPPPPPVASDSLPPRTTLAFGSPFYAGAPFISPDTPVSLAAVDDASVVGDGAGAGVAVTHWAIDDADFSAYAAPFTISGDGSRWIRYRSVDASGRAEETRLSSAAVDGTAPVSALSIGAPQAVLAGGEIVVGPATSLAVSAHDPVVNGAASGVAAALAGVDGAALSDAASFVLPAADGAHVVRTRAIDNVGNEEAPRASTVWRDGAAPATELALSAAALAAADGGAPFLGVSALISFTAADPASGGIAAGVERTEYSLDGGAAASYAGPFGLEEGARVLAYRSVDNVGNAEAWRSVSYRVDATAPRTTLASSGGTTLFGTDVLTADSSFSLSAQDLVSGVDRILYSVDGGADQVYSAPFSLGGGEHTLTFGAVDRAGNVEPRALVKVSAGSFLADALAGLESVTLSGGASVTGAVRTNGAFTANGKSKVNGAVTQGPGSLTASYDLEAASAVAEEYSDNAAIASRLDGGALHLSSNESYTLPAGDYYLTGLSLSGQSRLSVSGRVNIFLHGSLSVTGGAELNASGEANDLWIVADAGAVGLAGQSRSAFNLYAPLSNVSISGGGEFAGRVLGRAVALAGKALQPSTSSLTAPSHKNAAAPRVAAKAGSGAGTAGGGRVNGRDASVVSRELAPRAPKAERSEAALPPAPAAPAPAAAARSKRVPSSMPPFALSARAAFAPVGAEGRSVRSKDRSAVVIPAGAATAGLGVTVSPPKKSDALENRRQADVESRKRLLKASEGVQYGPEGTHFAKPVTLELPYDRAALPNGVLEKDLSVHYWNPVTGDWEKLESSVDAQNQIVRAQTSHFSLYQIFGGGSAASTPVGPNDPTFAVHAAYAFPNPSRRAEPAVIRIQPGQADSVSVRVYDLSGRMVHESGDFRGRSFDDGNGFGNQFTFDHTWDVSGVASGVYHFIVTAHKAGASDIRASGKIGVIK